MAKSLPLLLLLLGLWAECCLGRTNYAACKAKVQLLLQYNSTANASAPLPDNNATIFVPDFPDPIYHGDIYGFHGESRPVTLTLEGCENVCGTGVQLTTLDSAFGILTTWVLPVIALLSSLPYDSSRYLNNFEAFVNWIGGAAAALTTITWNILMTSRCRRLAERHADHRPGVKDALFILSCINQYQYPRRGRLEDARITAGMTSRRKSSVLILDDDRKRDTALLRGVLFPLLSHKDLASNQPLRIKLENITRHLAFQLRLQRKRGVFPMALAILWFLLALIVSIVTAFAQLGDNTTAHSLALGLGLSWLAILVVAAVVDRNPVSAERCGILIERWLYNVDALFAEAGLSSSRPTGLTPQTTRDDPSYEEISIETVPAAVKVSFAPVTYTRGRYLSIPDTPLDAVDDAYKSYEMTGITQVESAGGSIMTDYSVGSSARPRSLSGKIQQWRQGADISPFSISEYVGQGRRLRYCAVADTVLDMYDKKRVNLVLPGISDADTFKQGLEIRPWGWYVNWVVCQSLVGTAFAMAFIVAFNTPTIGLGCRSLGYLIWYTLSTFAPIMILFWQEPPKTIRYIAVVISTLAASSLFVIMGLQMTGGLNSCKCKASNFSSGYGGYMDFENGQFYHEHFDVKKWWGLATGLGLASSGLSIAWYYHQWSRDASLWRLREDHEPEIVEGVDLHWLT